jgi:hypothetical protein
MKKEVVYFVPVFNGDTDDVLGGTYLKGFVNNNSTLLQGRVIAQTGKVYHNSALESGYHTFTIECGYICNSDLEVIDPSYIWTVPYSIERVEEL